jgi:hypothetical protein
MVKAGIRKSVFPKIFFSLGMKQKKRSPSHGGTLMALSAYGAGTDTSII